MRKMLSLVQRDLLLINLKNGFSILFVELAVPLLFAYKIPEIMEFGCVPFLFTFFYAAFLTNQYLGMTELKYPRAEITLCAAPYSRSAVVAARYMTLGVSLLLTIAIYAVLAATVPALPMVTVRDILLALLIASLFYGIELPLQYKLGFEKMKFVNFIVIFSIPFATGLITKALAKHPLDFSGLLALSPGAKHGLMAALSALIIAASMTISVKIYRAKEL